MAAIIDGKKIAQEIKDELKEKAACLKEKGKTGALAVIQVGDDPASSVYVRNKKNACAYIGIESLSYEAFRRYHTAGAFGADSAIK